MKKIFWDNPYQTTLQTIVTTVDNNITLFDATIAYSFAGGQESDKASVNNIPILDSKMVDQLIYYTLLNDHGLKPGDQVTMEIDWPRRSRLMQLHFAAELILEIVTQKYKFEKIGAHIAETKARIDFIADHNISTFFEEIFLINSFAVFCIVSSWVFEREISERTSLNIFSVCIKIKGLRGL
jgi:Ser-tRNA(Ala) deacylase AlaX